MVSWKKHEQNKFVFFIITCQSIESNLDYVHKVTKITFIIVFV